MGRWRSKEPAGQSPMEGYSQLAEIGGGAFATVYRAVETGTGRQVALKILKVDTIHARLIETFNREIQALAKVSDHPNIVTLYRPATTSDGRPVLVLELCRESLGQQLRVSGPLEPAEVVRVGVKIAGALETAHRNGFLHRDMKPQNILVTQFGEAALADFGVAALQASAQLTAGVFGFTTLHAAPEMLEGHHLSPATDIYGLASTMYQLLTGLAPFAAFDNEAPASVILRILRDPVRPLRAENVPLSLADLLEAALSKQPEGRPRTALEFAQALQSVEAEQGWPSTAYVAWGEDPGSRSEPDRPDPPVALDLTDPRPRPPDHPSLDARPAPGVVAPAEEHGRRADGPAGRPGRAALPPLLPPVRPDPPASRERPPPEPPGGPPEPSGGPPEPPGGPPGPPVARPHPLGDDPPGRGRDRPPGPLPDPPPTRPRSRPAVNRPDPVARHVVAPEDARRGPPPVPLERPGPPLAPMGAPPQADSPSGARPDRPVYVDPEPGRLDAAPEPVHERTADPSNLLLPPVPPGPEESGAPVSGTRGRHPVPAVALAGIGAAVLVVLAAVLLAVGVI